MSIHDSHSIVAFVGWVGEDAEHVNVYLKEKGLKNCGVKQLTLRSEGRHLHCVGIPLENVAVNEGHFSALSLDIAEVNQAKRELVSWCYALKVRQRFSLHVVGQHEK
jgi:predicted nucleic acid-binding Zn finger protein